MTNPHTEAQKLFDSPAFKKLRDELIQVIGSASSNLKARGLGPSSPEAKDAYVKMIAEFQTHRGRELYYPYVSSGLGAGPYVELADGSVKLDMIAGIGVNFFGHSHPELMSEMITAVSSDPMQGNLQPGIEARELLAALLKRVAPSRLDRGVLTTCGTMANENALKIIRQKKFPATKILAFKDCFAGRSTAMAEITDNPGYRQGQPLYGEVLYLPFFDPQMGLEKSIQATLSQLGEFHTRYGDKIAALMIEPIQGEGGFNFAPREWYTRVFDEAKKNGYAIWFDEIQTFGRTGELFAFQKLGLSEYPDVVTVAKALQASIVLFASEYNPKPGLVAGTFTGSATALRTGRKILEILDQGYLGPNGKIAQLSSRFVSRFETMKSGSCKGRIGEIRALGGMIAFMPHQGTMDQVKRTLFKLFDLGVVAFYCGHNPYLIRMLPPLGCMNESDVDLVCSKIETALLETPEKQNS